MNPPPPSGFAFTAQEIKAFRIHAVLTAFITAAIMVMLPPGLGSLVGVVFGLIMLPLPPAVIYLMRRRKQKRTSGKR